MAGASPVAGFRNGLAAIPLYLVAVGAGHIALAMHWSDITVGLVRDGQAFSGMFLLGALFVLVGLIALPLTLLRERELTGLVRGGLAALAVAAMVVGYTASRGYLTGGTPGDVRCIVEQGQQLCPRGDGTWIADGRPDLVVMLLAVFGAYALSHAAARLRERRSAASI